MPTPELSFPYMFWAHEDSWTAPFALTQSGMPEPHAPFLTEEFQLELVHPCQQDQPAFEARLAELFGVEPERVMMTVGGSAAMALCAARWFREAGTISRTRPRVVTEVPSYEPFRALPELWGAERVILERRVEDRFHLDPDRVASALKGGRPAHAFLCTPHNPTGATSTAEELLAIAQACDDAGGLLISNEVYMEFAAPEERIHAALLAPNAVSLGSLTKAYGLGSLRLGWILLGESLVHERRSLLDLCYLGYVDPPTPSLRAGRLALDHLPELLAPLRRFEHECRPHLARWIEQTPGVEGFVGPHGLSAFPRVAGLTNGHEFAHLLAERHGVGVVPGEFFGAPGHLRISFGLPEATLVEGLDRLSRGLAEYRG